VAAIFYVSNYFYVSIISLKGTSISEIKADIN